MMAKTNGRAPAAALAGGELPITAPEVEGFQIEIVALGELIPHPLNYNAHPEAQIKHLIQSLRDNGFYRNIILAQDGTILAGHGVVQAARQMGLTHGPAIRLPIDPMSTQAMKVLVGDNEIARLGVVDDSGLAAILKSISQTADLLGTGYTDEAISNLLQSISPDERYSRKIEPPTYEPSAVMPELGDLTDDSRARRLLAEIDQAQGITEEERDFLRVAAQRHMVLHFNRIADYYAHASAAMQRLMENSALVIIDFDRAIELGYVKLTQRMIEIVGGEYDD